MNCKRFFSALTAAFLTALSGTAAFGSAEAADSGTMRRYMTAFDYAYDMGIGINLGNTLEAYWEDKSNLTTGASVIGQNTPQNYETCWGAVVTTQECIDGIRDAGFRTVRIPVYWGNMMADDGSYTINAQYIGRVQEIVDYCRKDGLYAVINVHHYDEYLIKHLSQTETLHAIDHIWTQIAEYFKGYSDYLIFEGFNEAVGSAQEGVTLSTAETYSYVNALNQQFVDSVRATGGNNADRVLIASGYWTNIDNTTNAQFKMPSDPAKDRLMVSVHYIDNVPYWSNRIGSDYWLSYSQNQCALLKSAFIDKGIPVFVGESTSIYSADHIAGGGGNSADYLKTILDMAVANDLIPVLWDVNNNFYSRTAYKIKSAANQTVITETAAAIAAKVQITEPVRGDLNADGKLDLSDVILLQKWLLGEDVTIADRQAADCDGSGRLNAADLTLLKRMLLAA